MEDGQFAVRSQLNVDLRVIRAAQSRAFNAFQGILRGIDIAAMADDQRPVHQWFLMKIQHHDQRDQRAEQQRKQLLMRKGIQTLSGLMPITAQLAAHPGEEARGKEWPRLDLFDLDDFIF